MAGSAGDAARVEMLRLDDGLFGRDAPAALPWRGRHRHAVVDEVFISNISNTRYLETSRTRLQLLCDTKGRKKEEKRER